MSTRTKTLPNHREGVREVMLDSLGRVLPVISATRVSYTPDRVTTYQRPEVDGFIVRASVEGGVVKVTFNRYMPHFDTVVPVVGEEEMVLHISKTMDKELFDWLVDIKDKKLSNLLPAGFGWDGIMTETEYAKHSRIRDLFIANNDWGEKDKAWFDNILTEAVRTSMVYLKLNWDDSFKILNGNIPIQRFLPTETKVYVVTFDKAGNRTLHLIRRPIHTCKKTESLPEIFTVPKGTVKVILLRTNVMIDDNMSYGVSIDLYK